MTEWLTFIGGVVSAVAWPVAVVWLLLAYKKPVKKILTAVAKRVADLEELNSPVGGAKFGERVKEVAEELREGIEDSDSDEQDLSVADSSTITDSVTADLEVDHGRSDSKPGPIEEEDRSPTDVGESDHGSRSGSSTAENRPDIAPTPAESEHPQSTSRPRVPSKEPQTAEEIRKQWVEILGKLRDDSPLTRTQHSGSQWSKFESKILDLGKVSPRAGVIEAWSEVEQSAVLMMVAANPAVQPRTVLSGFGRTMRRMGLPNFWVDAFEGLRRLRNYAAHEVAFNASTQDLSNYASTAWTLKEGFDDIADALKEAERHKRYLDER